MKLTPIDQVVIPTNRFRRDFDEKAHRELYASIQRLGLLNLPIVRGTEIVAGERRYRAIKALADAGVAISYGGQPIELGQFPCLDWADLDPITAREIELQENTARLDLSWQERAHATKALLDLRREQDPSYDVAKLTEELGYAPGSVTAVKERIIIADHLDVPGVGKSATEADAKKILKRYIENEYAGQLALIEPDAAFSRVLKLCSFEELLAAVPPFDVLLTDPPYGQDADTIRANIKLGHKYSDDWNSVVVKLHALAELSFARARPQAHAYTFCAIEHFFSLADMFDAAGWQVWPRPLIWHKDVGHIPAANFGPKYDYECILFANKGQKPVTFGNASSILQHDAVKKENKLHAAEKPVSLLVELLQRSCITGDLVVDPFCGSGPIFEAATQLGLVAWGSDTDAVAVGNAKQRMLR